MSKERGTSPEYPDIPPLYPNYYPRYYAGGPPSEHWAPRDSDGDVQERRPGLWSRLKAWFARPASKRVAEVPPLELPLLVALSKHADEHRPERPILLAVDHFEGLDRRIAVRRGLPICG
jgi:hypothetical protein